MSLDAVAHATGAEFRPVPVRLAVAVVAGFGAAAIANLPMSALPEGEVPPRVALVALWPDAPRDVVPLASRSVHYLAGISVAVGIELLLIAVEGLRTTHVLLLRWVPLVRLGAAVAAAVAVWTLFAALVLPRDGPDLLDAYGRRAGPIRRDWFVSALVYAVAVAVLVPSLYVLLPV
jgi:hypothetical protein